MKTEITRKKAKEMGLIRYYSGNPCIRNHDAERLVSNKKCVVCLRERAHKRQKDFSSRDGYLKRKLAAIKHKGGKCEDCGWLGHHSGFEFDHPNGRGNEKKYKYNIAYYLTRTGWPRICEELEKVNLVCAICHNYRTWSRNQ